MVPAMIHVAYWPSLGKRAGDCIETTWDLHWAELRSSALPPPPDHIRGDKAKRQLWKEKKLPGWSPGWFEPAERAELSLRELYALGADLETVPLEEAAQQWGRHAGMIHTTISHSAAQPALRLVLYTSRPIIADEYRALHHGWLMPQLPGWADRPRDAKAAAKAVSKAKDPARLWFAPLADAEWRELAGKPLDVDTLLPLARAEMERLERAHRVSAAALPRVASRAAAYIRAAVEATGRRLASAERGDRHHAAAREGYALGGLVHAGLEIESTVQHLMSATDAAGWDASRRENTERALRDGLREGQREPIDIEARLVAQPRVAEGSAPCAVELAEGTDPHSDLANADRLVAWHGASLRYCDQLGGWHAWDGRRWAVDEAAAYRAAEATAREMMRLAESNDDRKHAADSQNTGKLEAMLRVASRRAGVLARPGDFDADPWILNVANGILDLRGGTLGPHDRTRLCRKISPAEWHGPDASHPMLDSFLEFACEPHKGLRGFLERMAGLALYGGNPFEAFFIVYDQKRSNTGKSTWNDALAGTLGDYAVAASPETFMAHDTRRMSGAEPSPDLARLAGTRLVLCSETRKGAKLDAALVKRATSDTLTARFLNKDLFQFNVTFKVQIAANYPPAIPSDEVAILRRLYIIPMDRVVPVEQRSTRVKEVLSDPAQVGPAILAMAMRGCLAWQRAAGLEPPPCVREATESYRAANDPLRDFLVERCELFDGALPEAEEGRADALREAGWWVASSRLRAEYQAWGREEERVDPGSLLGPRSFADALKARGLIGRSDRPPNGGASRRVWYGVRLLGALDRE